MKTVSRKGDGFFCVVEFGGFNASCPEIRVNKTSLFFNVENEESAERTLRLGLWAVRKMHFVYPFQREDAKSAKVREGLLTLICAICGKICRIFLTFKLDLKKQLTDS